VTAHGSDERWVVLCHESASEDTIPKWNTDKLTPIPSAGSKVLMFDHLNPPGKGMEVVPDTDPFRVQWETKGGPVRPSNRIDPKLKLDVDDIVMITVQPPPDASAKFKVGDTIALTLIYIRVDYRQEIDVVQMFDVVRHGTTSAPTTAKRNLDSPGKADTWEMIVTQETESVNLLLKLKDRMGMHSNMPLWLRATITTGGKTITHDFRQFGAIILK